MKTEHGYIRHDSPTDLSLIFMMSEGNMKATDIQDRDEDDAIQGAWLSSNDDVLVTFEYESSYLKSAYHILSYCHKCESKAVYNFDQAIVDLCPVTQEELNTWAKESQSWDDFKKTAGYQKLIGMSEDERDDFSDENHFSSLN